MAFVSMVKDLVKESKMYKNSELGLRVRIIDNPDGTISINAEDTAVGFGWTQTQNKNGKQYTSIRWETLNEYCKDLGFPNKLGKDDYIPEPLFYRLGMKAGNKTAETFQNWLAFEVIPSIRKHGAYMTGETLEKALTSPDFLIQLATKLKEEREARIRAEQRNAVLMHVNRTYTMTEIAKELGLRSATELNKMLADLHIQYKVNKTWVMYSDYSHLGYEDIKQEVLDNGTVVYHRKITQAGREFIVNLINKTE